MLYLVNRAAKRPGLDGQWNSPAWHDATIASVDRFHRASSDHRPRAQVKLLHDDTGVHAIFRVADRYVVCRRTEHQSRTHKDTCVELFVQPFPDQGYFNFELNCGGALLLYYITDAAPAGTRLFNEYVEIPPQLLESVRIYHSMPKQVLTEVVEPLEWTVQMFIPYALIERYVGPLGAPSQRRWRGNFYKCADESSHPHWASWAPIGPDLRFHVPQYFQPFVFK